MSTDKPLKFAIAFAHMDLAACSVAERRELETKIAQFVGSEGPHSGAMTGDTLTFFAPPPPYDDTLIEGLQDAVKRLLLPDVRQAPGGGIMMLQGPEQGVSARLSLFMSPLGYPTSNRIFVLRGELIDAFLTVVFVLVAQTPADKFLLCPECSTLFLRVRRQKYCSNLCVKRVNMRQWRKSKKKGE